VRLTLYVRCSLVVAVVVLIGACGSSSTVPPTLASIPRLNASADSAAVLAATAHQRVFVDNSRGGSTVFDTVYVLDKLGSPIGPRLDLTAPSTIDDAERDAVAKALAPARVEWVPDSCSVPNAIAPGSRPVTAILVLGVPFIRGDKAEAVSNLWCNTACAAGGAYSLARSNDGHWRVTGHVGPTT
jgi:hypothetical protein